MATAADFAGNPQETNKLFQCPNSTSACAHAGLWTTVNPIAFKKGKSYKITLELVEDCYDMNGYARWAELTPSTSYIDDPENLLGQSDECCIDYHPPPSCCEYLDGDKVAWMHVPKVDIDIDSDNNNGTQLPDRSKAEEDKEDILSDPSKPGKIILVDSLDYDSDGIPGLADGFNHLGPSISFDDISTDTEFVPVVVQVSGFSPSQSLLVTLGYSASNPNGMTASATAPFVLPEGTLRLWTKQGSASRNPAAIGQGGDYVAPGTYVPEVLGLSPSNGTVTFYAETVKPSSSIADQTISLQVSVNGWAGYSDVIRITSSKVTLLGRNFGETEFVEVGGLVGTTLAPPLSLPVGPGLTYGAWQTYKATVHDPRPSLAGIEIAGQVISISANGPSQYSTPEFICLSENVPDGADLPNYPLVTIGRSPVPGSYNPDWHWWSEPDLNDPLERDRFFQQKLIDVVDEMEQENWTPAAGGYNPDDAGAYGKEIHKRVSTKWPVNPNG